MPHVSLTKKLFYQIFFRKVKSGSLMYIYKNIINPALSLNYKGAVRKQHAHKYSLHQYVTTVVPIGALS